MRNERGAATCKYIMACFFSRQVCLSFSADAVKPGEQVERQGEDEEESVGSGSSSSSSYSTTRSTGLIQSRGAVEVVGGLNHLFD